MNKKSRAFIRSCQVFRAVVGRRKKKNCGGRDVMFHSRSIGRGLLTLQSIFGRISLNLLDGFKPTGGIIFLFRHKN